jgi:hypothetical protein
VASAVTSSGAEAGRKKRAGVLAAGHGEEEKGCSPPAVGRKRRGEGVLATGCGEEEKGCSPPREEEKGLFS